MSNLDELFEELTETQHPSKAKEEIPKQEEIIFTVAEFSNLLKGTLEQTFKRIKIKGEIIGLKKHSSGTCYFDLKENFAGKDYILNCVLWKWTRINTKIEDGLEVIITGKITAYTGRSSYQITVEDVEVAGIGALLKIIEERKQKLATEGLFDLSHKKPIPKFPKIIGVITSPTGAVIRDIIHRITDRFPTRIIVYPVAVQGEGADKEITDAINNFNKLTHDKPDVLIVARGGGSMQDLMPFNEENVVRATYNSEIPIISAVGHETDTTLIDYASDLRAPTPTGAAEKAVPVRQEIILSISEYSSRFLSTIVRLFENFNLKISNFSNRIKNPNQFIEDSIQRLDDKATKLDLIIKNKISSLNDKMNFTNTM
ncbi:MAG: exodeoxyribonuclease VII large subunit, partial [Alphaproteobacteria bacterium]|nr:exodeoxyribonuclease VII large subunit [Alphaproteobacteria bacterium]